MLKCVWSPDSKQPTRDVTFLWLRLIVPIRSEEAIDLKHEIVVIDRVD